MEHPQEKANLGVKNNPEQQEADPMTGLEKATSEFRANTEKLDGLLKSEKGVDLPTEEAGKFSALKENIVSKFEGLKDVLKGMAPIAAVGAFALPLGLGIEDLRQTMDISKELVAIGLADVAAVVGLIGYMNNH